MGRAASGHGFGGATLWAHLAKALFGRPRPQLVVALVRLPRDGSLPSAHTTQIVAFALCIVLIIRRTLPEWQWAAAIPALVLTAVVGVSRVYLPLHYPSDILAGALLAMAWIAVVQNLL
jgi:membrane-associated phospholipid phosphatase